MPLSRYDAAKTPGDVRGDNARDVAAVERVRSRSEGACYRIRKMECCEMAECNGTEDARHEGAGIACRYEA